MTALWKNWCVVEGFKPVPATPRNVVRFVKALAQEMDMDEIWPHVQAISRDHYTVGLADPTLGGLVAAEINKISKIQPPRSWGGEAAASFMRLPYDLQLYTIEREELRNRALRRAQNEYAEARKKHAETKAA
jgi:hypothetical protein